MKCAACDFQSPSTSLFKDGVCIHCIDRMYDVHSEMVKLMETETIDNRGNTRWLKTFAADTSKFARLAVREVNHGA
jgi:hypothetical protein